MDSDAIQWASREYYRVMDHAEEIVLDALCDTFKRVTGKPPSDNIRDAFASAIRCEL